MRTIVIGGNLSNRRVFDALEQAVRADKLLSYDANGGFDERGSLARYLLSLEAAEDQSDSQPEFHVEAPEGRMTHIRQACHTHGLDYVYTHSTAGNPTLRGMREIHAPSSKFPATRFPEDDGSAPAAHLKNLMDQKRYADVEACLRFATYPESSIERSLDISIELSNDLRAELDLEATAPSIR